MNISKTTITVISVFLFIALPSNEIYADADEQYPISRVTQMPNLPEPYRMRNWSKVAKDYDTFVFDFDKTGNFLPIITWDSTHTVNSEATFVLPSYVGGSINKGGEAINCIAAVVSASLVGINKRNQNGYDWVSMCNKFYAKNTSGIYLNDPGGGWGSGSFWYDILPNILFYQLSWLYPNVDTFPNDFISVANRWYEACTFMGGSESNVPDFNHKAFNFRTKTPVNGDWTEPDAAAGISWLEYMAWVKTGDQRFLTAAKWGQQFLENINYNPYYEILLAYGAYTAARMNAELGTEYDLHKIINWCFEPSSARPGWGIVIGKWGSYDCGGLAGSITDSDGYAFTMNTFESAGALVPLVRYDNHYARAVGKWILNLANAARYFYANGLPVDNQDGESWALTYDSTFCISFEGLRHEWHNMIPSATGDAFRLGWAPTNFALYGGSHVGILGSIVDTTNVEAILQLDLLKTDYFHDDAYPTYLYYNPYETNQTVHIDVGNESKNLYDAVKNVFLDRDISNNTSFTIPADSAIILVITPANGTITYDGYKLLVNNIIVDYHYSTIPDTSNLAPIITDLRADPSEVHRGTTSTLMCQAYDPDGDDVTYLWESVGGSIEGNNSSAIWIAPDQIGTYYVSCTVQDSYGKETRDGLNMVVVDTSAGSSVDLAAYYPFNGNANDESGNFFHGTVYGATLTSDRFGRENSAYYFDGVYDRIQVTNTPTLNFQDSITVNFWIKPAVIPDQETETYPISHGSWEERWKFTFMANRRIRWTINTTNDIRDLDSNAELDTNHVYFVSGLYDGASMKLYINGAFDSSLPLSGLIDTTGLDLTIAQSKPGVTNYNFNGIIDDIRIYGRTLTEEEILDLYQESLNTASENVLPTHYFLSPNIPNPFNSITTIHYEIPIQTHVTFIVFNLLGQIIDVLVDEEKNPGKYLVQWNVSQMSSGVYLYQIQAADYTKVRKCLVLK